MILQISKSCLVRPKETLKILVELKKQTADYARFSVEIALPGGMWSALVIPPPETVVRTNFVRAQTTDGILTTEAPSKLIEIDMSITAWVRVIQYIDKNEKQTAIAKISVKKNFFYFWRFLQKKYLPPIEREHLFLLTANGEKLC